MKIDTRCHPHQSDPSVCIKKSTVGMIVATGEAHNYKLADLTLAINGMQYAVEADELPILMLLGTDLLIVKLIVNGLKKDQLAVYTTKTEMSTLKIRHVRMTSLVHQRRTLL